MTSINLNKDKLHGDWNYMIKPRKNRLVKMGEV
jgi:hypothetical protein